MALLSYEYVTNSIVTALGTV